MKSSEYLQYMESIDFLRDLMNQFRRGPLNDHWDHQIPKKLEQAAQRLVTLRNRVMEHERKEQEELEALANDLNRRHGEHNSQ